jgi:ADP-heptose:LPS heptosyltransferase
MTVHLIQQKISRRLRSIACWPLRTIKNAWSKTLTFLCTILTHPYWLIDYLPARRNNVRRIAIMRLDLIGDFVLWLDAAKELKQIYPSSHLVLYANAVWSDIAKQLPYWDAVIPVDVPRARTDLLYRLRIFLKIRFQSFDVTLQPTFSREYLGDLAVRASSSPHRIGHFGDSNNIEKDKKCITDTWYTQLVDTGSDKSKMELQTNAHFISILGDDNYVSGLPAIPVLCSLPAHLGLKHPYIAIIPGASWLPRAWPIEYFVELIKQLNSGKKRNIVLCGSPDELGLCAHIAASCPDNSIENLAGRTSLIQMIEVLRNAQLVIGNESSAIHIAAATNTPSVCIAGGGHYGRFVPYPLQRIPSLNLPVIIAHQMDCFGCRWACSVKASTESIVPCISKISVSDVLAQCETLLGVKTD